MIALNETEPTDLMLMEQMREGDDSALETLFNRYRNVVYAVCLRVLKNEADAEDALIDIFTELWQRPDRFNSGRGGVSSYLLMLARSRAIDRLRSRASRRRTLALDGLQDMGQFGDTRDDPQQAYWIAERRRKVRQLLGCLPPAQREAVNYAFFHGLSHSEIAEKLNIPLGTVKTRIRSGLLRFRDLLKDLDDEQLTPKRPTPRWRATAAAAG